MQQDMVANAIVVATTVAVVALAVMLHYEGLSALSKRRPSNDAQLGHRGVVVVVLWLFALHVAEIWLFGLAYWMLVAKLGLGGISGSTDTGLLEAVYLSATTYSTVGFGDVAPTGPIRFLAGTEALVGLMMITWSASYTYLEMSRRWRD
ncbi:potassium channel family protein [Luteimonas vadosa]|uniref:Potassium channel family protein n=1 Tax=Luteimonas vadosa TaxID=1165507 RepID=A0ABP9E6A3_9GAMM